MVGIREFAKYIRGKSISIRRCPDCPEFPALDEQVATFCALELDTNLQPLTGRIL